MADFTLQLACVLVLGLPGSGKTTFIVRYVLNSPEAACCFVFDWNDRFACRVPWIRPCYTAHELEMIGLPQRFVVFNPSSDDFERNRRAMDGVYRNERLKLKQRSPHQGMNSVLRTTHRQNFIVPPRRHRSFPLAEISPDGSSVITKHPGTGGAVVTRPSPG